MGVRPARDEDLPTLRDIERAAGRAFAGLRMDLGAEDEDRPVSYLLADVVDRCAHLEQVSVHPHSAYRRPLAAEAARRLDRWPRTALRLDLRCS